MSQKKTLCMIGAALVLLLGGASVLYDRLGSQVEQDSLAVQEQNQGDTAEKERIPAPDFTVYDRDGNEVHLSDFSGKPVILNFWASWCGPCRLNNPELKKIYEEFRDKGLVIIGISLDDEKEDWEMAIEADGLDWINVSSLKGWDCDIARLYNVKGVPALFILDENNNIIATGLRDEQLKIFLHENLK